jgi:hypothetical protein
MKRTNTAAVAAALASLPAVARTGAHSAIIANAVRMLVEMGQPVTAATVAARLDADAAWLSDGAAKAASKAAAAALR